jgi:hypothetical protein
MNQDLTYKLLKYLIQGAVIYLLFKYVPNEPMKDSDILIITAIILLVYIIAENFYNMYFGIRSSDCGCSNKEGFDGSAVNSALSAIGGSTSGNADLSSIGSALSQITTGSVTSPVGSLAGSVGSSVGSVSSSSSVSQPVQTKIVSPEISQVQQAVNDAIMIQQMKDQSNQAFQQGQQQMNQAQQVLFGQENQNNANQVQQVQQTPSQVPGQARQITFPISGENPKTVNGYTRNADGSYTVVATNPISETPFAYNFNDYNQFPPSTNAFEPGYSFLPPANWYPTPPVAPMCIPSGPTCPVCPIYTEGTNMDLKLWNSSLSITPPEQINIRLN